jgi:hypothetical protein
MGQRVGRRTKNGDPDAKESGALSLHAICDVSADIPCLILKIERDVLEVFSIVEPLSILGATIAIVDAVVLAC